MTTTPPEAPLDPGTPPQGPRVSRDEVTDLGRLRRTRHDSKVAGVAGGLARHLDIDPVILRVAFVVLAFFGGAGILLYAAVWLLVPRDGSDDAAIRLDIRSRTVALALVGALAVLAVLGDSLGGWGFPWPLLIIGVIALLVVNTRRNPGSPAYPTDPGFPTDYAGPAPGTPPPAAYRYRPPAPNPRKRGPILFWFTMAVIALAVGTLGIVDLAGVEVTPSAYPALALGITGSMLLVGAFFGRAGGLILVGILLAVGTAGTSVAERIDYSDTRVAPILADDLDARYSYNLADVVIDLSDITDPASLDGRTLEVELDLGEVVVIVPDDVDVDAQATIDGFGSARLFENDRDGSGGDVFSGRYDAPVIAGTEAPRLTINVRAGIGEVTIITEEGRS